MRKPLLTLLLGLAGSTALCAQSTDWLNFAYREGGEVPYSINFKFGGKLYFDSDGMLYIDLNTTKGIPYENFFYVYFSDKNDGPGEEVGVNIVNQVLPTLVYDRNTRQIVFTGDEPADIISLYSMQGMPIKEEMNTKTVSVKGYEGSIIIANAQKKDKRYTAKIVIK